MMFEPGCQTSRPQRAADVGVIPGTKKPHTQPAHPKAFFLVQMEHQSISAFFQRRDKKFYHLSYCFFLFGNISHGYLETQVGRFSEISVSGSESGSVSKQFAAKRIDSDSDTDTDGYVNGWT